MNRKQLRRMLARRAGRRCEYCKMHDSLQGATFHLEHIKPTSMEGGDELDNLCYACTGCNLRKAARVDIEVPQSGELVTIFIPRTQKWNDHFLWAGYRLQGRTALGRATIAFFGLNSSRRIRIREAEGHWGLHPPA